MKLTLKSIEAAVAGETEYVLWDHDLSCFGLRVRPGGAKTFIVRTRIGKGRGARKITVTLGKPGVMTVEDARRKARLSIAEATSGKPPAAASKPSRGEMTVAGLCSLWIEKASGRSRQRGKLAGQIRNPRNIAIDVGRIESHILPLIGKTKLSEVKTATITRFRDAVARGDTRQETKTRPRGVRRVQGGEGTASRTLRLLSSILSFGVREGLLETNPALGVEKTPDRSLERFLSPDEMRRLGETLLKFEETYAPETALAIIRMPALSGARKGEIEKLTWREVDLRTGLLRLAPQRRAGGVRRRPSSPERVSENLRLATDHTQTPSGPHIASLKVGPGSPASLGPNRIEACERTGAFAKRNAVPNTLANAPLLS